MLELIIYQDNNSKAIRIAEGTGLDLHINNSIFVHILLIPKSGCALIISFFSKASNICRILHHYFHFIALKKLI
jgi:hypothetical protein